MTERVDHAEEAVSDIRYADEVLADGGDSEVAKAIAAVAQVHATLALVEQRRIANLIALWTVDGADEATLSNAGFPFGRALAEIREGLGL